MTETLHALAVLRRPKIVPERICILTTEDAYPEVVSALLGRGGAIRRLASEYRLPERSLQCSPEDVVVLRSRAGRPLSDIRSSADSRAAGDAIAAVLADLQADPDAELHCSLAGGRKTMGALLALALQISARPGDRLYHVLVSEPFEKTQQFFYPPHRPVVYQIGGRRVDLRSARIDLAEIPIVRMGTVADALGIEAGDLARKAAQIEAAMLGGKTEAWLDYYATRKPMEAALNSIAERIRADTCAVSDAETRLAGLWNSIATRRNPFAHGGMCDVEVRPEAEADSMNALLETCISRCGDDAHWRTDRTVEVGDLLVTPLGLSPGVLYTALTRMHPDSVIVLACREASVRLAEICERAGYPESGIHVELIEDPHRCFQSGAGAAAGARNRVMAARSVTVNVTGGTTALQYVAERVGRDAERLGVPVRRVALVDSRPFAEQQAQPFVAGEVIVLDEAQPAATRTA